MANYTFKDASGNTQTAAAASLVVLASASSTTNLTTLNVG